VVAAEGWFFRINSKRHFRPHFAIAASDNPGCLDYDSFVELRGIIEYDLEEIAEAMSRADARVLGRISAATASAMIAAVRAAPTLTTDEAVRIIGALSASYAIAE
jgi:hypothetical protein